MSTDLIDNKIEESNGVARNIDNIKKSYPDEWVLLRNPVSDEYDRTISGVVLYHSRDKKELAYRDKPLLKKYKKTALFFNRVTPREKRAVIASIYSEKNVQTCFRT